MGPLPDSGALSNSMLIGLTMLLDGAIKGTIVLALAGLLSLLLRPASAAARHLLWCVALSAVVALPLLSAAVPGRQWPILPPEGVWSSGARACAGRRGATAPRS